MGQAALVLGFEPHLHSSGRRMCVEAPASERVSGDAELCRIQPQLGEGVSLPGRCDTVAPQGHGDQGHRVVRQHGVESARRGPAQLEGLGSRSIDEPMFLLSRVIWLTDDEYDAEMAGRAEKAARATQNNNN